MKKKKTEVKKCHACEKAATDIKGAYTGLKFCSKKCMQVNYFKMKPDEHYPRV